MKKHICILLVLFFITSSCMNYFLQKYGIYDNEIKLVSFQDKEKRIVFFPMAHIGTPSFYKDVSFKIDSLSKIGYVFYLEGVRFKDSLNNQQKDTYYRKFRKVSGIPVAKIDGGHLDTLTNSLIALNKKVKFKKEITNQPSYFNLGIDTIRNTYVDRGIDKMVIKYEDIYGSIILEECDYLTEVSESSVCEDKAIYDYQKFRKEITLDYRNNHIVEKIKSDNRTKIALIYGKGHLDGIKENLEQIGFKLLN